MLGSENWCGGMAAGDEQALLHAPALMDTRLRMLSGGRENSNPLKH